MRKNKTIIKSILVILLAIFPLTPILSNVHGENLAQHTFQGARPINELFPDENLARVIVEHLDKSNPSDAVTINELKGIARLTAENENIRDLTGMEYLIDTMYIMLFNNKISDLSPLENLANVDVLDLRSNHITDVSPLKGKTIMELNLDDNHISDLSPLESFMFMPSATANDQTIVLPDTALGKPTNFVLRNSDGLEPSHTIIGGNEVGTYENSQLTWFTAGNHKMTWDNQRYFSGKITQTAISSDTIRDHFPDPILAQRIATVLNGDNNIDVVVSMEELANISDLSIVNEEVTNLEGMQLLTGLRTLEIVGTEVSDIHPIGGLINLISLDLRNNEIENINPLSNLTNLITLLLDRNKIDDISALSTLVHLNNLLLASNQISDVTPLKNLKDLRFLSLDDNHVMDISSLPQVTIKFSAMNQRVTLDRGYLSVPQKISLLNQYGEYPSVVIRIGAGTFVDGVLTWTETTPDGINMLEWIGPGSFQGVLEQKVEATTTIYDLFEDENLAKAIALTLNNNEANAVVDTDQLKDIETLNIAGRGIFNLSGMQHLEGLKFLNASSNSINDLSPLAGLTELQVLDLEMNHIEDITPLENMKKLTRLSLNNNALTDISILSDGFNNLTTFTAISQIVILPEASVGKPTPLTLLDNDSNVPTITYIIGTGNYDSASNMLTWTTEGENYLRWASTTNFSGVLSQRVDGATIKGLFPDENLAQVIATRLGKDSINAVVTFDELASITNISAPNKDIHSIEGVQYLTNLRGLSVFLNQITDITPLRNLNNLTTLYIGINEITDITPLAGLENLETLDMGHNKISDISSAAHLPSLMRLRFSSNHVTDISSLGKIVDGLRDFNASNQIIDLPKVVVGQPTPIFIRDQRGDIPIFTYIDGQGGTIVNDQLTWTATGDNSLRWSSGLTFSGRVRQTVVANDDEL